MESRREKNVGIEIVGRDFFHRGNDERLACAHGQREQ